MQPFVGSSHAKSEVPTAALLDSRSACGPNQTAFGRLEGDNKVRGALSMRVKHACIHLLQETGIHPRKRRGSGKHSPAQVQTLKRLTFLQQDSFTWPMLRNGYNRVNF